MLNKNKPPERDGKVLFIDANQEGGFRTGKARNFLDPEHIARIADAYRAFSDEERFAHVADIEEIASNDYNLNISRYVDTTEPIDVPSVEEALALLREARSGATRRRGGWMICSRSLGMPDSTGGAVCARVFRRGLIV